MSSTATATHRRPNPNTKPTTVDAPRHRVESCADTATVDHGVNAGHWPEMARRAGVHDRGLESDCFSWANCATCRPFECRGRGKDRSGPLNRSNLLRGTPSRDSLANGPREFFPCPGRFLASMVLRSPGIVYGAASPKASESGRAAPRRTARPRDRPRRPSRDGDCRPPGMS